MLLKLNIKLPIIQRLKDSDKIKQIIEYQESYFKKKSHFNFLNNLSVSLNIVALSSDKVWFFLKMFKL